MITGSPHYTWRRLFDPLSIDMVKLPDHLIRHGAGYLNVPLFWHEQGCLMPWFTWGSLHDPLIRHGEGSLIPSLDMEIVIWSPHWHGESYLTPSLDMEKITWSPHCQGESYLIHSLTKRGLPDPLIDMEKARSNSWNLTVPFISWSNTLNKLSLTTSGWHLQ